MSLSELMACDPARDDMLILVDVHDREVGAATKERAHVDALLHRAFSVVLMRDGETGPEVLVAKRSLAKYHSGGLWANSCCSHPRVGEKTIDAAYRRVHEELGCEAVGLREISSFVYRADFENGITEYEFDTSCSAVSRARSCRILPRQARSAGSASTCWLRRSRRRRSCFPHGRPGCSPTYPRFSLCGEYAVGTRFPPYPLRIKYEGLLEPPSGRETWPQ